MAGNAEVRVAIVGDNSSLQRSLNESKSSLATWGAAVGKVALAAGIAAAGGLALLGKASVDAASQAQQSIGATETVFGKYADSVIRNSKRAATALGLSADEYRNNANVLGSLLGNQGVAQDKLAGKTQNLVKMGADLAATFGGTTTDAVNALASAFKGEFDPLEQYGVSIKQSAINTEAMKVAGVETTAAFNDLSTAQQGAAKQTATTNLLTKQAAKSQGAFARETDTLAHQQQVLDAQWENLKAQLGTALLPAVTDFVQLLNDKAVPAVSELARDHLPALRKSLSNLFDGDPGAKVSAIGDALGDVDWDSISSAAGDLADTLKELGPALADVSVDTVNDGFKVFGEVIGFAADHLETLRKVLPLIVAGYVALKGAQLLNQAVGKDSLIGGALQLAQTRQLITANRELAAAIREGNTAQGAMTGSMTGATGGLSKLKLAAGAAAGIGGLGLVTASTQVANDKVSGLMSTLGSAAMGAAAGSVFGPWGTAIGGVVGGLTGLVGQLGGTGEAMERAKQPAVDYASSLDAVSAAATEATRELIYNQLVTDDALTAANSLGISSRTMVDAVLGQKDALAEVDAAIKTNSGNVVKWTDQYGISHEILDQSNADAIAVASALGTTTAALKKDTAAQKAKNKAVIDYGDKLNSLPPRVKTVIEESGMALTAKGIAKLVDQYDLARKDVKTLIAASGTEISVRKVQALIDRMNALHDRTITVTTVTVNKRGGVTSSAGGHSADPDVPRREIAERGRTDGKTYADAFGDSARKTSLLDKLFGSKGAQAGLDAITAGIEAAASLIDKTVNRRIKDDKHAAKVQARILDGLKKQAKALRENGRLQDANTQKLTDARNAVTAYAGAIKESFVAFGDITQLGRTDTGKVTLGKLLRDLGKRAADAREFNALLQQLAAAGLDQKQIEQLTAAGPETALATARAIASGGQFAINEVNNLSRDIATSGGVLGDALADRFAIGGQASAFAYITTLENEQTRLDKSAKRMAKAYVAELQTQLAAVNGGGGHGNGPNDNGDGNNRQPVVVRLTSQQVSSLERGREIQLDLDTFHAAGGRGRR